MRALGRSAIITGSARGIGLATAKKLAANGGDVLVNALEDEELNFAFEEVRKVSNAKVAKFKADVSDEEQVNAMVDYAIAEFGTVDILINNAAISVPQPFLQYSTEHWKHELNVDLHSVFYTCSHVVKEMVQHGNGGNIVNLSSIGATKPHRQMIAYDTSKGAIDAFTKALALEVAPWGITVNAIAPAAILGYFVKEMDAEVAQRKDPKDFVTPIPRQGTPEDVANLALFLSSHESSYITGTVIPIDGGLGIQARNISLAPLEITPQNIHEKMGW